MKGFALCLALLIGLLGGVVLRLKQEARAQQARKEFQADLAERLAFEQLRTQVSKAEGELLERASRRLEREEGMRLQADERLVFDYGRGRFLVMSSGAGVTATAPIDSKAAPAPEKGGPDGRAP